MKIYTVHAERDGKWWAITSPDLPGLFSQTRHLVDAGAMARDGIALLLDVPHNAFEVRVVPILEEELLQEVAVAIEDRQAAEVAEANRARSMTRAAKLLIGAGLTVRDAAAILKVSHQWIAKLAHDPAPVGQSPASSIDPMQARHTNSPQKVGRRRQGSGERSPLTSST